MGKVIQSTGLVGGNTAKSLCNATFAIRLFNVGRLTEWLSLPTLVFVWWVGFFLVLP